jgi:hypothetical protein
MYPVAFTMREDSRFPPRFQRRSDPRAASPLSFLGQMDFELSADRRLNLLSDGGFEGKYWNGGFGWRAEQTLSSGLDTSQFHSGRRALRFVFLGPAFSDSGVSQYVPVEPNVRYHLRKKTRSEIQCSRIMPFFIA